MTNTAIPGSWPSAALPTTAQDVLRHARSVTFVGSIEELAALSVPADRVDARGFYAVAYDVPGRGPVLEAEVCRVRNGVSANYPEPYMRRRDPDCVFIADDQRTDQPRFVEQFGKPFETVRQETLEWLKTQDLVCLFFKAGAAGPAMPSMAILPLNAGFFGLGLGMMQGVVPLEEVDAGFVVQAIVYVAPPFRHTHFAGRQVVVHNRTDGLHELFSYNLYPGPSAKKGVYGMLLALGEREGWVTAHCSTVQVVTPYDNICTIMHEGASGGGKSEMLEYIHRESDGRVKLGVNLVTGETRYIQLPRGCALHPVTDDMALCHPSFQRAGDRKLRLSDAEAAWFLRVNHINGYGVEPHLESLTTCPSRPLLFLNIDAVPGSTALIWEHTMDSPGKACPNPRVVVPRGDVPNIVNTPVTIDVRSFGVRTPPCTAADPTYGILGLFHILPPALAWLWRLVAPRGYDNPSIVDTGGMSSEGVGSYWPFATGRRVDQANLVLKQVFDTTDTLFVLCPNQHVGVWKVGFAAQWVMREYLARRGHAPFRPDTIGPARSPLLGYVPKVIHVEGAVIGHWLLHVESQPEVGIAGYDAGAAILKDFFEEQLVKFLDADLDPLGRRIIEACLAGASVEDYQAFTG
jgi:hypothetical protein